MKMGAAENAETGKEDRMDRQQAKSAEGVALRLDPTAQVLPPVGRNHPFLVCKFSLQQSERVSSSDNIYARNLDFT